jgi:hypothetical protein
MRPAKPVNLQLPLVPMNEEDKFLIQTIYGTRLRYYVWGYVMLVFVVLLQALMVLGKGAPIIEYVFVVSPYIVFLSILAIVIFRLRIYPLWMDMRSGMKEKLTYTVVRKSHFPITNQYYVSFDDPRYMHYEVDADFFYAISEGDTIPVYRGKYSKLVFEKNGRFSIV